jgi:hypothetical protein
MIPVRGYGGHRVAVREGGAEDAQDVLCGGEGDRCGGRRVDSGQESEKQQEKRRDDQAHHNQAVAEPNPQLDQIKRVIAASVEREAHEAAPDLGRTRALRGVAWLIQRDSPGCWERFLHIWCLVAVASPALTAFADKPPLGQIKKQRELALGSAP